MIYIYLTPGEYRHYVRLMQPSAVFRAADHETPAGQRELQIKALESVIGFDGPRARIRENDVQVHNKGHDSNIPRWT